MMIKDNYKVIKHVSLIILFILLLIVFFYLLAATRDDKVIKDIKEYIKTGNKIIYISDKNNYSKYPIELFERYDIDYYYINSDNLSSIEKTKLEKIINSSYLSNIIIIYENGKIKDAIIEYKDEESLNKFLQENEIIPEIIGDSKEVLTKLNSLLDSDYLIMYIPYKKNDVMDYQINVLKDISKDYDINFEIVEAYLLSSSQKSKLESILQISSVEDQIVILIKDGKIVGSIREIMNKKNYLTKLDELKYIDEVNSYITYISYNEFNNLINSDKKNIITIGKDDCKYCDEAIKTLNDIATNYDININYINVGKVDSSVSADIEKALSKLNYKDGFTTPLTIIVENGNLVDYVVGMASEEFFTQLFRQNGIIK